MEGWKYLLTFGYTTYVYEKGIDREIVDKDTGKVILEYKVKK